MLKLAAKHRSRQMSLRRDRNTIYSCHLHTASDFTCCYVNAVSYAPIGANQAIPQKAAKPQEKAAHA